MNFCRFSLGARKFFNVDNSIVYLDLEAEVPHKILFISVYISTLPRCEIKIKYKSSLYTRTFAQDIPFYACVHCFPVFSSDLCILQSPIPPQYVLWYHNDKMMNYETTREGVTVTTEPGIRTHSRLIINNATPKDSGNYSCRSSNAEPDTTYVFVSHGKTYR